MHSATETSTVPAEILSAMRETNALFCREVVEGQNYEALERVYTADARVLPPGAPMQSGRAAIIDFWRNVVSSMGVKTATLETVEAHLAGSEVVEIGRAQLKLESASAGVKYVVIWRGEQGVWKWHIDIWNPEPEES